MALGVVQATCMVRAAARGVVGQPAGAVISRENQPPLVACCGDPGTEETRLVGPRGQPRAGDPGTGDSVLRLGAGHVVITVRLCPSDGESSGACAMTLGALEMARCGAARGDSGARRGAATAEPACAWGRPQDSGCTCPTARPAICGPASPRTGDQDRHAAPRAWAGGGGVGCPGVCAGPVEAASAAEVKADVPADVVALDGASPMPSGHCMRPAGAPEGFARSAPPSPAKGSGVSGWLLSARSHCSGRLSGSAAAAGAGLLSHGWPSEFSLSMISWTKALSGCQSTLFEEA
mmetsp:Transcript_70255/g.206049  ORF Transcript_70255/g.206049 Transcript_70255/m.206049 type:complete len:292 (+) Transcript_70255:140-1015(+)